EAEQRRPAGLALRFRGINRVGSGVQPEPVPGTPSLPMRHLDGGDCIATEHITEEGGEARGKRYRGPHWFFREPDKGYWRSQFILVSPKDRELEVETVGEVPPPSVKDKGLFVERSWRVDESAPSPAEPDSPNPREF